MGQSIAGALTDMMENKAGKRIFEGCAFLLFDDSRTNNGNSDSSDKEVRKHGTIRNLFLQGQATMLAWSSDPPIKV